MRRAVAVSWWVLGSAIVALLVAWVWPHRPVEAPVGASGVLAIARAAASAPRGPAAARGASDGGAVPLERGADEVNLCGDRWLKVNPDGSTDDAAFDRAIGLTDARSRLLAALRADRSDYAQAVAMRLEMAPPWGRSGSLDALAKIASTTSDPRVYALALGACRPPVASGAGTVTSGACQQLSSAQWARLDAGNAAPWLAVLADASARHDTPSQVDALFHIAQSARSDDRFLGLAGELLAHAQSDDASLPATLAMAMDAAVLDAAQSTSTFGDLVALCNGAALNDSNRRQLCTGAAELLFSKADTLMARRVGAAIGRRLGWPPERIEQARGEETAYFAAALTQKSAGPRDACADMRADLGELRERARLGEMGAIRAWAAQSGLQPADFVQIERDARTQRAAEAAASGAPAGLSGAESETAAAAPAAASAASATDAG